MDWVILDGFDADNGAADEIRTTLRRRLDEAGRRHTCFRVSQMQIAACRSCGACGYKSPGKCVLKDDLHEIMRTVARGSVLVFLTPIRFGGYPSQLKKVLERFMNLGYPTYMVRDGYLLHPMRYGEKSLLVIGVAETDLPSQEATFRLLAKRNARNLVARHTRAVVVRPGGYIAGPIGDAVEEALSWQN
ncbi:MAG TPA: NAD(P)H-dependent oxidoreductase [Symbiobacteriaceae bacterium]|nr:NAD(P)H-dependent oxidoreductase [Symbiobacteriaceae bacterium]